MIEKIGDGWVDSDVCSQCRFVYCCCAKGGGGYTYSLDDFPNFHPENPMADKENVRELIESGTHRIDYSFAMGHEALYTLGAAWSYYIDWKPCVHYDPDTGCEKEFKDRPAVCRIFKPGATREDCSISDEEMHNVYKTWLPHQAVLQELYKDQPPVPNDVEY